MVTLDSFLPLLLPHVSGASNALALQALRWTCIDFCRRTEVVQRLLDPVDVAANTQDYAVVAPAQMALVRVLGVGWQGTWLAAVPPGGVTSDVALRGAAVGTASPRYGNPRYYFQKVPSATAVSLYPIPDTALVGGLTIKAAFVPTPTASSVDDGLFNDWAEAIAAGAAARMMAIPRQVFSGDPTALLGVYQHYIGDARRRALQGTQLGTGYVTPRRFA